MDTTDNTLAGAGAAEAKAFTDEQLAQLAGAVAKSLNIEKQVADALTATASQRSPVDITKNGADLDDQSDVDTLMEEALKHVVFKGKYAERATTKAEEVFRQVNAIGRKVLSKKGYRAIQKDMTTGGAGTGAELIAVQYNREAITPIVNITSILNRLYPVDMGGEKSVNIPKYIGRPTAYMVGENTAITPSGATTDEVVLTAKKVAVLSAPISSELLMFSRTPILSDVIRFSQEAIALKKQSQVTLGAGNTTNAQGFDKIDAGREVTQAGAVLDWVDAYRLKHGVLKGYRANAAFGMTDAAIQAFSTVKNEQGSPVLQTPITPNDPYTLIGYPVEEIPDIEGDGTVSSPTRVYFGNWRAFYGLATSGGQRIDQTNVANDNFTHDTVQVRLIEMFDGAVLLDESMCFMDINF